jgi:formate-dependent nitrite reductase cytochrome c552 subunit
MKKTGVHAKHLEKDISCEKCHNPTVTQGGDRYSIHDHKFYFGKPALTKAQKVDQTCKSCHEKRKEG